MSVIVYRDGIMAADSRAYSGCHRIIGRKAKIRRLEDGTLVGVATSVPGLGEYLIEWFENGSEELSPLPAGKYDPSFTLLAVTPRGEAFQADDALCLSGPIVAGFFAIGTGGSLAIGAMAHGATALEAALIAAEYEPLCGPPVATISHKRKTLTWHTRS